MAGERIGQGTALQYSTNGTDYTTIAKLTEIGEVSLGEADDVEITHHQSADGHREFIRGLIDAGEISMTGSWVADASQQTLITRLQLGPTIDPDYIKVVFPGSLGTFTARGYVKSFMLNPQLDDKFEFSGAIKVTGKPTFAVP